MSRVLVFHDLPGNKERAEPWLSWQACIDTHRYSRHTRNPNKRKTLDAITSKTASAKGNQVKRPRFAQKQGRQMAISRRSLTLSGLLLAAQVTLLPGPSMARVMDGFFAYCTSNNDGTGECVNEEDGRKITCLIVPGQIISCPAASRSLECVWISGITANQAQFWCDPEDEAALYGAAIGDALPRALDNVLEGGSGSGTNGEAPIKNTFEDEF
jgi:hypothetical protein